MERKELRKVLDDYLEACERLIKMYQESSQSFEQLLEQYPDVRRRWEENIKSLQESAEKENKVREKPGGELRISSPFSFPADPERSNVDTQRDNEKAGERDEPKQEMERRR